MLRNMLLASSFAAAVLLAVSGASSATPSPGSGGATLAASGGTAPAAPVSGDAVFRATGRDPVPYAGYTGHAGIVSGTSVLDMQPSIASLGGGSATGRFSMCSLGVWRRAASYWGAAHMGQSRETGLLIEASVKSQRYATLSVTVGYKSPGVSFRSDGLVEWAYESNGLDIVPGDTWSTLSPAAQMRAMTPR